MVDVHCHILPIDDGARNDAQALDMARMAQRGGTTVIVATPHFNPDSRLLEEFVQERDAALLRLNNQLTEEGIALRLTGAAEILLHPYVLDLPLEALAIGGRYLLVELPFTRVPHWFRDVLFGLQVKGFSPILAHPERYPYLMQEDELLEELIQTGLLLQVNTTSLSGGWERKNALTLLREGWVSLLASDAHSTGGRNPDMSQTLHTLTRRCGDALVNALADNAQAVLEGRDTHLVAWQKRSLFHKQPTVLREHDHT